MKKTLLPYLLSFTVFAACTKDSFETPDMQPEEACLPQTGRPTGISYAKDSVVAYTCTSKHCGLLPLSTRNYWIYEDSIFSQGEFAQVKFDTLRFTTTWKSLSDGLVWWESNISVGLPSRLYANDSAFYKIQERMFTPGFIDAKKDFSLFPGDSLRYLSNFDDVAAHGRSLRITSPLKSPAGSFSDCIYFEKNARNYRKDQVYFKPGIGVIKYVREDAQPGSPSLKLQKVSTLVAYHIE